MFLLASFPRRVRRGSEGKLLTQEFTYSKVIITQVPKSSAKHFPALDTKAKRVKCLNAFSYAHGREKGQGLGGVGPQGSYLE